MRTHRLIVLLVVFVVSAALCPAVPGGQREGSADSLVLTARSRVPLEDDGERVRVVLKRLEWKPGETAVIICDMWDQHWCKGASKRVAEMASYMNKVAGMARDRGILIVHAPSGTMDHYEGHPARKRASGAPKAENLPDGIGKWCHWIDEREKEAGYPIDHSDGGCDCEPTCKQGSPWTRQIGAIEIQDEDAISDSGVEIWNLLEQRGVGNVIIMGVHTNMCVLGRPFGLRHMARHGKNVVLMRDLTDTMYNSKMTPKVNHFTGTDLVVEHVERYVCPTVTSTVFTGEPPFVFENDNRPRVVIISAEREYGAVETMPQFANLLQREYGCHSDVIQGAAAGDDTDRHLIGGMEALANADLAMIFVRRRAFPDGQMQYLRDFLKAGKPLIGLRTASHAFDTRGDVPDGHSDWRAFDPEVLGGNYHGHYGRDPKTTVTPVADAASHPIVADVELPFTSESSLYKTGPLAESARLLLIGTIPDHEFEPVAWTNRYGRSRVFYTSLGHTSDFANPAFEKMLVNAVFWGMQREVPR